MKKLIVSTILATAAVAAQANILILSAAQASYSNDVKAKIQGTGLVTGSIDILSVSSTTPTLTTLLPYDAVLVFSDSPYGNAVALGNVLADYVDQGRGVVEMTFSHWNTSLGLGMSGRFVSGNYDVFSPGTQGNCGDLGVRAIPGHALFAGVSSFDGGSSAYCNTGIAVKSGATLLASWTNGEEFAAIRTDHAGTVLGLNFYAPSSDARGDFWNASTDGARLMANALNIASVPGIQAVPEPASVVLVVGAVLVAGAGARLRRQQGA